jgi:hypothetical protein
VQRVSSMRTFLTLPTFMLGLAFAIAPVGGCDRVKTDQSKTSQSSPPAAKASVPAGFVIERSPDGAADVAAVKKSAVKAGDDVVVRGIVGGAEQPFTADRAVFQIMDSSVMTCDKMGMADCKTPWDACCHQDEAKAKGATVQVVDAAGNPLKGTLEGVGGLKPAKEVIVKGKARTVDGKSFVIDATSVFVKG